MEWAVERATWPRFLGRGWTMSIGTNATRGLDHDRSCSGIHDYRRTFLSLLGPPPFGFSPLRPDPCRSIWSWWNGRRGRGKGGKRKTDSLSTTQHTRGRAGMVSQKYSTPAVRSEQWWISPRSPETPLLPLGERQKYVLYRLRRRHLDGGPKAVGTESPSENCCFCSTGREKEKRKKERELRKTVQQTGRARKRKRGQKRRGWGKRGRGKESNRTEEVSEHVGERKVEVERVCWPRGTGTDAEVRK